MYKVILVNLKNQFYLLLWAILESTCFSVIPSQEIYGLLDATNPEYRHISPLWGCVALDGGMLEALRFYGNYTFSSNNQEHRKDIAADPVAQLIQKLFPSPDGGTLVPSSYMHNPAGFLSRHLECVNDIIRVLLSTDLADKKTSIIDVLRPKQSGAFVYPKGINAISGSVASKFAETILAAHDYSPANNMPYPQHTAIIALMAFFVSVADKVEALDKLMFLMKNGFNAKKDLKKFTEEEFLAQLQNIPEIMHNDNINPELVFLMNTAVNPQERIFIAALPYRGDIKGENQQQFSDCAETSLRNFFWKISHLAPMTLENFFINIEKENSSIHEHQPYQKLKNFVLNEELLGQKSQEAHSTWAQIVSNLNEAKSGLDFDDVAYTKSTSEITTGANYTQKKLGGLYNMLNVIAKLIPDSTFSESWMIDHTQTVDMVAKECANKAQKKLTRLCSLVSPNFAYTLENQPPFTSVTFSYSNSKLLEWDFKQTHFSFRLLTENLVN